MRLTVINSGSSGNCYVIQDEEEAIILEAGMSLAKVKQVLGFDVGKVSAVLITHAHGDHAKYAKDFENVFQVYANKHVIETRGLKWTKEIEAGKGFMCGNFKVLPFQAHHDIPCVGYFINHKKTGNIMFLTDSFLCDYSFKNIKHILLECNYSDEALAESVKRGLHWSVRDRVQLSHMELQTTKKVLLQQDLSEVYNIVLLHLSSQNSDPKLMFDTIAKATGKPIVIARKDLELELHNQIY